MPAREPARAPSGSQSRAPRCLALVEEGVLERGQRLDRPVDCALAPGARGAGEGPAATTGVDVDRRRPPTGVAKPQVRGPAAPHGADRVSWWGLQCVDELDESVGIRGQRVRRGDGFDCGLLSQATMASRATARHTTRRLIARSHPARASRAREPTPSTAATTGRAPGSPAGPGG